MEAEMRRHKAIENERMKDVKQGQKILTIFLKTNFNSGNAADNEGNVKQQKVGKNSNC